jgi:hypothetical protein
MAFQLLWGSLSLLALALLVWLEKEKKKESVQVMPWQLDSRLAQEVSLSRLRRERELEQSQFEQPRIVQE